jgi:hypothetical protein
MLLLSIIVGHSDLAQDFLDALVAAIEKVGAPVMDKTDVPVTSIQGFLGSWDGSGEREVLTNVLKQCLKGEEELPLSAFRAKNIELISRFSFRTLFQ